MTLSVDLDALAPSVRYKLLTATIIPRPVAWVTTSNADGSTNAAPYSFFNVFGQDPALVVLGLQHKADGTPKDTTVNIRRSGEFVVNIADEALTEVMVATAAAFATGVSEPEALGLATAPATGVGVRRLGAAPVSISCTRKVALSFSEERELLVGEAVGLDARDGLIDTATWRVDWDGYWPIARLFADKYARLEEIAPHAIPSVADAPEKEPHT